MDGRIHASFLHRSHESELSWLNLSNNWVQPCYFDRLMARNQVRVTQSSILYIYKVFKQLLMQWMVLLTSQKHGGGLIAMEDKGQQ